MNHIYITVSNIKTSKVSDVYYTCTLKCVPHTSIYGIKFFYSEKKNMEECVHRAGMPLAAKVNRGICKD